MTEQPDRPDRRPRLDEAIARRANRRRDRLNADFRREREVGRRVPTWVMAAVLGAFLAGWLYLILTR